MSANDPKRTFTSLLLKWRYRVHLVEDLQHDGVGRAERTALKDSVAPNARPVIGIRFAVTPSRSLIARKIFPDFWIISRHRVTSASCPLFPSKRTFISAFCTSA